MGSVKYVPGEGSRHSDIVFVGEAPGEEEDMQGRPFVGRSGKMLEKWLNEFLGLSRDQVYITNVVKVRPDDNRTPTDDELKSWKPSLLKEIEAIDPIVIVTLGISAAKVLLDKDITRLSPYRGTTIPTGRFMVFPIYHPSYILRQPGAEKLVRGDLEILKEYLVEYEKARDPG